VQTDKQANRQLQLYLNDTCLYIVFKSYGVVLRCLLMFNELVGTEAGHYHNYRKQRFVSLMLCVWQSSQVRCYLKEVVIASPGCSIIRYMPTESGEHLSVDHCAWMWLQVWCSRCQSVYISTPHCHPLLSLWNSVCPMSL